MHSAMLAALLAVGGLSAQQQAAIESAVNVVMRSASVPGLSLGIARNGTILMTRGYGDRTANQTAPIGSLTKQFTAAAMLQLVAAGRVHLDDPVHDYLSDDDRDAKVTLTQLLSQTSGIPSYDDAPGFDQHLAYAPRQLLALVADQPLEFTPGTRFAYSNTNYVLAGLILERVESVSYAQVVRRRLLVPLALKATSYTDPAGYAAAGLSSNVGDLLAWETALLQNRVLPQHWTDALFTPARLADGTVDEYGYGFYLGKMYGRLVAYHTGYVTGYSAIDLLGLETGLELVILTDAGETDLIPLAKSIVAIADGT